MNTIAERVERGARLLDLKVPGWERKINRAVFNGSFDMTSWSQCVAGTLELVKFVDDTDDLVESPLTICLNGSSLVGLDEAELHGFTLARSCSDEEWAKLEEHWLAEVDSRLDDRSGGHGE